MKIQSYLIRRAIELLEVNFIFAVQSFVRQVVRILIANPLLITTLVAITLVCLVHPALGLFVLLLSHIVCCHSSLSRFTIITSTRILELSLYFLIMVAFLY